MDARTTPGQQTPALPAQLFMTAPTPCPYLPGQNEQKLFTPLTNGETDEPLHNFLTRAGFRRSQFIAYKPVCPQCAACVPVRVPVKDFWRLRPGGALRRILRRNSDLTVKSLPPVATNEQFDLLSAYLARRHPDSGMTGMSQSDYQSMVEDTPIPTRIIEYRAGKRLVGAALTDKLSDGLSMVYTFFNTSDKNRGYGNFMILDHVRLCRESGLDYLYLGYWIAGSRKMAYKAMFSPLERLEGTSWHPFTPPPATPPLASADDARIMAARC